MPASPPPVIPVLAATPPTGNSSSRLTTSVSDGSKSDFSVKFENLLKSGETLKPPFTLNALIGEFRGATNASSTGLAANGKNLPNAAFASLENSETLSEYTLLNTNSSTETLEPAPFPILLVPNSSLPLAVDPIVADPLLPATTIKSDLSATVGARLGANVNNEGLPIVNAEIASGKTLPSFKVDADNVLLGDESRAISRLQEVQEQLIRIGPDTATKNSGLDNAANQIGRIIERFSEVRGQGNSSVAPTSTINPLTYTEGTSSPTTNSVSQLRVDVPLGDTQWQRAFAERVIISIDKGQSAQLRLTPAELGPIDINLNVDDDKIRLVFNAQQAVVKEQIEAALPKLREMLAEQGLELDDVSVTHDDAAKHDGEAQKNSEQASSRGIGSDGNEVEADSQTTNTHTISLSNAAVDYFV